MCARADGVFSLPPPARAAAASWALLVSPPVEPMFPPVVLYYLWVDARVARVFVRGVRLPIPS